MDDVADDLARAECGLHARIRERTLLPRRNAELSVMGMLESELS
jgi:hypothetical protein